MAFNRARILANVSQDRRQTLYPRSEKHERMDEEEPPPTNERTTRQHQSENPWPLRLLRHSRQPSQAQKFCLRNHLPMEEMAQSKRRQEIHYLGKILGGNQCLLSHADNQNCAPQMLSEPISGRTGCRKSARPDLWGSHQATDGSTRRSFAVVPQRAEGQTPYQPGPVGPGDWHR